MKKHTLLRLLSLVLLSLMIFSLVACGGDKKNEDSDKDEENETVVLTLITDGGVLEEGKDDEITYKKGTKVRSLPKVTKENAEFLGWYDDNGVKATLPFTIEEDTYLTASWKENGSANGSQFDGETVTVTLELNGGKVPDGTALSFEVEVDGKIGTLPTPTRAGYTFLGWFEDGNEKWEIDKKSTVEDEDITIHALWQANGNIITVEFFLNADETLEAGAETYFEMVAGQRISDFINKLPTATKDGNKFVGWKDASGNRVSLTTKVTSDLRLSPVWTKIVLCHDGTENHQWNAWQDYSEVTCTTPAQQARTCNVCGGIEYNTTQEATGHKYGNWSTVISSDGVVRSRTCVECDDKEADPLTNIAYDSFKSPIVDGDIWGTNPGPNLFDKDYEMNNTKAFAGKGTGAIVVTTEAKELTYVDMIAVTGYGSSTYTVVVTYENGDTKDLGMGSFGQGDGATKTFNVNANITKIVVTMASCSIGSDYWVELSILVVPEA